MLPMLKSNHKVEQWTRMPSLSGRSYRDQNILYGVDITTLKADESYQRLCDISKLPEEERISWVDLPEVTTRESIEQLSSLELEVNELVFSLIISEFVYNQELSHLVELVRSSIHWKDSLPLFNRRSIVGCATRVKKCSNILVKRLSEEVGALTDLHRVYNILEKGYSYSLQVLIAYCDILDDARSMIRRVILNDSTLMTYAFSTRCHIEYMLLPIRHLQQTISSLQKILHLLHSLEIKEHYLQCQQLILTVSEIKVHCYKILSQHGTNFLADIDNLLDFSRNLSNIRQKRLSVLREKEVSKQLNRKLDSYESFDLIDLNSTENLVTDENSLDESKKLPLKNDGKNNCMKDKNCYQMIELTNLNATNIQQMNLGTDSCTLHLNRRKLKKSFQDEPLYQVYSQAINESTMGGEENRTNSVFYTYLDLPENIYEEIDYKGKQEGTVTKHTLGLRTLWCETDEVIASGILNKLSSSQKALQEYKFEILTSEVSYLKSINVLITLFVESVELAAVLNLEERQALYGNIIDVRRASEIFLFDLAGHWEEDYMLSNIYSVVHRHSMTSFRVYIEFCSNQVRFHRILQHLLLTNKEFVDIVAKIETSSECHGYSLQSFLSLPMQRVTRLPLILQTIQRRLNVGTPEYTSCNTTLSVLNQLVQECNEGVRKTEQSEQILALNNILNQEESTEDKTESSTEENNEKTKKKNSLTSLNSLKSWKFFSTQEC